MTCCSGGRGAPEDADLNILALSHHCDTCHEQELASMGAGAGPHGQRFLFREV